MKNKCSIESDALRNYYRSVCSPVGWVLAIIVLVCLANSCCCRYEHFWDVQFSDVIQLGLFVLAYVAILSARQLQEANVLSNHLDIYKDEKMCSYIRVLRNLSLPAGFHERTRTSANNPDGRIEINPGDFAWYEDEDEARRKVKFFYANALDLYKRGYVGKNFLDKLVELDAFMVLFEIVEPMECCLNSEYNYELFYELMSLYEEKFGCLKQRQKHQGPKRVLRGKRSEAPTTQGE